MRKNVGNFDVMPTLSLMFNELVGLVILFASFNVHYEIASNEQSLSHTHTHTKLVSPIFNVNYSNETNQ